MSGVGNLVLDPLFIVPHRLLLKWIFRQPHEKFIKLPLMERASELTHPGLSLPEVIHARRYQFTVLAAVLH